MEMKIGQEVYLAPGGYLETPGQRINAIECGIGLVTAVYPDTEEGSCSVKFSNGSTYTGTSMMLFCTKEGYAAWTTRRIQITKDFTKTTIIGGETVTKLHKI